MLLLRPLRGALAPRRFLPLACDRRRDWNISTKLWMTIGAESLALVFVNTICVAGSASFLFWLKEVAPQVRAAVPVATRATSTQLESFPTTFSASCDAATACSQRLHIVRTRRKRRSARSVWIRRMLGGACVAAQSLLCRDAATFIGATI